MKSSLTILLTLIFSTITACNTKQTATANIFERREVEENKLMIKYVFTVKGESITDSAIIDNKVLNSDSVSITYDPTNPSENSVQLPE
ncbi:MAG TPA: hypothetical protein VF622_13185 [Segetibacter sp.]|jgi:hypothetical protein